MTVLDEEKLSSQKVINELITNSNFNKKGESEKEDPKAASKLKSKINQLEEQNLVNTKNFDMKIQDYDEKIKKMQGLFEASNSSKLLEKKIDDLGRENMEIKSKYEVSIGKEKTLNVENIKLKEKVKKYKKSFTELVEKTDKEKIEKKAEPPKFGLTGKHSDMLLIANKIEEIEQKNKDREEHYKLLCVNANQQQLNKELESMNKKFEAERKEYQRVIHNKNAELMDIKKDFQDLITEMEEMKHVKKGR